MAEQKRKSTKRQAEGRRRTGASARGKRRRVPSAGRQPLLESFRHAFDGILIGITERNMKIHCLAALLVVFFGLFLHISAMEWCVCLALFGLVMGLELVNTAVEAVVDLVTQEYQPLAKRAKDTAAGAVLIAAIMAAAAGLIIFIPRLLYLLRNLF
ncbi:MAG: diacylglycerol kinase family protein [Eubacteriales bacterium]|nr:diacylglycerol kinase family protein [Eubacteriales bacterium]